MTSTTPCEDWAEVVSAYADGEASGDEKRQVQAHLRSCVACGQWWEAVRRDREVYSQAFAEGPRGPAWVGQVIEQLGGRRVTRRRGGLASDADQLFVVPAASRSWR
jgi:anti-sigma factor RsiW